MCTKLVVIIVKNIFHHLIFLWLSCIKSHLSNKPKQCILTYFFTISFNYIVECRWNYRNDFRRTLHVVVDGNVCDLHGIYLQRHHFLDAADVWHELERDGGVQLHEPRPSLWFRSAVAQRKKFLSLSKFHENESLSHSR